VRKTASDFTSRLRKLSETKGIDEYRAVLRQYINALKEIYRDWEA
jgi:hypothetical protein